jgi:radical SAM protein with 4Fe4S-binding SPASM domain
MNQYKKSELEPKNTNKNIFNYFILQKRIFKNKIKRKVEPFPTFFQIQTTNLCNGSCLMCPVSSRLKIKPKKMSDKLFKKIINEIIDYDLSFTQISLYLQNEPLMDEDIFNKYKLIKKLSKGQIFTGIVTNGTLFSDKNIKELVDSNIDSVLISLDSVKKETYNKIRQGLNFKKVINNIEKINNSKFSKKFGLKFVLQKENIDELREFKKYWNSKGVPVTIALLNNRSGDVINYNSLSLKKRKIPISLKINNLIANPANMDCHYPFLNFNILYNGDVIICCNDYNKKIVLGNLNESSIKEIWNSKKYQEIRELFYNKEYEKIPACATCDKVV